MKNAFLAGLVVGALTAAPALAGPDFVRNATRPGVGDLAASDGDGVMGPMDDVLFAHNSSTLPRVAVDQLTTVAEWLKRHPKQTLVVEGYADSSGFSAYNQDLAMRRASMVRSHLIARGVPGHRIMVIGYGDSTAEMRPSALDRRAVMYATDVPVTEIVRKSFDKGALHAMWVTPDQTLVTERRSSRLESPTRTIISRR